MSKDNRPLSPHLQIYRLPMLAWLSISHRITGMFLSIAVILLPAWLWLIAEGEESYASTHTIINAWYGQVFLFAVSFSLVFHTLSGIRHLIWDTGFNLDVRGAEKSGYLVIVLTILLTTLIWWSAFKKIVGGLA
ncbi:MAG: succinate dehydrogenase, cytochrome b556 subunit [Gammaproteobacteria bacterium]|nr:succinate dehydrogenase, cytochrome b556 subunit [Gammaproteobacteria bacterium]